MFVFCKRCGLIINTKKVNKKCDACDTQMQPIPTEYLSSSGMMFISQDKKKEFEELIKQGKEFDETSYENREKIIKEKELKHREEILEKVDNYNRTRTKIECPVCHSEALEKISNVGKVVKVGVFGILGAGDIGKKYKCKSCGYRF